MMISYLYFIFSITIIFTMGIVVAFLIFYHDRKKSDKKFEEKKLQRFLKKYNNYISKQEKFKQDGLKT